MTGVQTCALPISRGEMSARRLIAFKHQNALGNAPAHRLFDAVTVMRKAGGDGPARSYGDYDVSIDRAGIPPEVEVIEGI